MFVADAHCDTLFSLGVGGKNIGECMITPQRLAEGHVAIQTFAMFAGAGGVNGQPYLNGRKMLDAIPRLGVPVYTGDLPDEAPDTPHGVLSIEGGEMLEGSLERLWEFDNAGRVRMIALTWNYPNQIGHPAKEGSDEGLTPFGKKLLKEMDKLGILPDTSHLNEAGFWDVVENASLPPIASHSNLKKLCGHFRNLTDEQAKAIIRRGGFIGVNFYSRFLTDGPTATLEDVVRHIDSIAQLGGIDALGFGSDFDGIEEWPEGLGDPRGFNTIRDMLVNRGYTDQDIEKIAGGNLFRLLKKAQDARRASAV